MYAYENRFREYDDNDTGILIIERTNIKLAGRHMAGQKMKDLKLAPRLEQCKQLFSQHCLLCLRRKQEDGQGL